MRTVGMIIKEKKKPGKKEIKVPTF